MKLQTSRTITVMATLLCVLVAWGCAEKPPDSVLIGDELRTPFATLAVLDAPGASFSEALSRELSVALLAVQETHRENPGWDEALATFVGEVSAETDYAAEQGWWAKTLTLCDAAQTLAPDSGLFTRQRRAADLQVYRPEVAITGVMSREGDETSVLVRTYVPKTRETVNERIHVGETFVQEPYTLKLQSILEGNSGVVLKYVATGETFEVWK